MVYEGPYYGSVAKQGFVRVKVFWTTVWYHEIAGLYNTVAEVQAHLNELKARDSRWENVQLSENGRYILDGERRIAMYNYQHEEHVGHWASRIFEKVTSCPQDTNK
jgi:hypothetical protein